MRILFVALLPPFPPLNGHRLRTWVLLQALAAEGHEVTLLSFGEPDGLSAANGPLRTLCERVEFFAVPRASEGWKHALLGRVQALFSGLPYGAWRFRSSTLQQRLEELMAQQRFDAVLCDGVYNMVNLPAAVPAPVLLNKDDVAHVILQRYLKLERNPAKQLYGRLEAYKVRRWEQEACQTTTMVLACSEHDRGILQRLCPGIPIAVLPNVVDTESYRPAGEGIPLTVLYQGGMDWFPNRDAVEFFVGAILPELRKLAPGVKFVVAGRTPREAFRRRFVAHRDVVFTGSVADMRAEIAKASVCVVPLRIGSGTRLKILEAAAMAKSVVSTRLGVEGLEFIDGEEILLADEPSAFARAVAALLADSARREALGRAARRRVERQYSLSAMRAALRQALAEVAVQESARSGEAEACVAVSEVRS